MGVIFLVVCFQKRIFLLIIIQKNLDSISANILNVRLREFTWEHGYGIVGMGAWIRECGDGSVGMGGTRRERGNGSMEMGAWKREHGDWSMMTGAWGWDRRDGSLEMGAWGWVCGDRSVGNFFCFLLGEKIIDQMISFLMLSWKSGNLSLFVW